jgi:hypothetical protein
MAREATRADDGNTDQPGPMLIGRAACAVRAQPSGQSSCSRACRQGAFNIDWDVAGIARVTVI